MAKRADPPGVEGDLEALQEAGEEAAEQARAVAVGHPSAEAHVPVYLDLALYEQAQALVAALGEAGSGPDSVSTLLEEALRRELARLGARR